MTTLIGLLGGKGAGKSTAAEYLTKKFAGKQYAIADELKYLVKGIYGFTDTQMWGTQAQKEEPVLGFSPRQGMETVGTALRKVYGDDFQVARLLQSIVNDAPPVAVVSDVRYANEAKFIRESNTRVHGGTVFTPIFLIRLQYAPGLRRWPSSHQSEQEWQSVRVDLEITPGAGGVSELYASLDSACSMLGVSARVGATVTPMSAGRLDEPYTNWQGIAAFLGTTPNAVKYLSLTPPYKCRTCWGDPRGEMIDCAGSLGYRPCPTCTQESDHKFHARSA